MTTWIWVALGGASGALLRWGVAEWTVSRGFTGFPWATLTVNLIGSGLLAFIAAWAAGPESLWSRQAGLRAFATVGLMGALTTYSTFNLEVLQLAMAQRWAHAAAYGLATGVGALAVAALGLAAGRAVA